MPDEPEQITAAGRKVVDMLAACAAAPDNTDTGHAADDALNNQREVIQAHGHTGSNQNGRSGRGS